MMLNQGTPPLGKQPSIGAMVHNPHNILLSKLGVAIANLKLSSSGVIAVQQSDLQDSKERLGPGLRSLPG